MTARTLASSSSGLYGVAELLGCAPELALDVLLNSQLLPFVSTQGDLRVASLTDL